MLFRNEKKGDGEQGSGPVRVPLLPLRDIIVFPHMVVPLFVGRQRSIKALEEATQKQSLIFLSSQKDAKTNDPAEDDIYRVGTLGTVVQLLRLPDGTVKVLVEGKKRARVSRYVSNAEYFLVEAEPTEVAKRGLRILVAGDSHTQGAVGVAETFPNLLEACLRAAGRADCEVLNAGVAFTGPRCYLERLRHYLFLEPDVFVAALFTGNDFWDDLRLAYAKGGWWVPDEEAYRARLALSFKYEA